MVLHLEAAFQKLPQDSRFEGLIVVKLNNIFIIIFLYVYIYIFANLNLFSSGMSSIANNKKQSSTIEKHQSSSGFISLYVVRIVT